MVLSTAVKSQINEDNLKALKNDLVEKLMTSSRFEEAGDLIDPLQNFNMALDCYLKANNYQKAIKICNLHNHDE